MASCTSRDSAVRAAEKPLLLARSNLARSSSPLERGLHVARYGIQPAQPCTENRAEKHWAGPGGG